MNDWFPEMEEVERSMSGGGTRAIPSTRRTVVTRLLSLLVEHGWSRRVVTSMFRTLSDSHIGTHHVFGLAKEWMKYKARTVAAETPKDVLLAIGARPSIIRILERRILIPFANTCYTDPQLVDMSIEMLLWPAPITAPDPYARQTHLFEPETVNRWFFLPDEDDDSSRPPCINLPFRSSHFRETQVQALLDTLSTHNPATHDLHFHTTSWGSISPILRELHHTKGRTCLDFGLHPGFYLSQRVHDALDWGHTLSRKFVNEIAIVVFSLPKTFPSTLRMKHLGGDEWAAITQEARRCVSDPRRIEDRSVPEIASIRRYDFLFGNMVANVYDVFRNRAHPVTHTPPKTQLTSKTRRGDLFLQEHIVGCLFFQKYIPPTNTGRTANATRRTTRNGTTSRR